MSIMYVPGIEKRDDELATLYDILFDDELYCGIKMFTETRRCYRLTKQAFINISYGLSLQNGLSGQGNAQAAYKLKKNDGPSASNNNDWRMARSEVSPQKGYSSRNQQNNVNNNAPSTVSQFFSAYRQPNAKSFSSLSQHAKEELDARSLRPQNAPLTAPQPQSLKPQGRAVDAEFQAMWNQLQQKLPTTLAPANPPQPPPSTVISPKAVSEQTNALKKFLKIREGDLPLQLPLNPALVPPPCGHTNSCVGELSAMCQRLGLSYKFCHKVDQQTGEVSGILTFPDGVEFVGPKCSDTPKASEAVACLAVQQYPAVLAKRSVSNSSKPLGMKGGPPGVPISAARVPFPQGIIPMGGRVPVARGRPEQLIQTLPRPSQPPPLIPSNLLPTPPQQWCLQEPRAAAKVPPPFSNQQPAGSPKQNLFVPLQAQTAAILKDSDVKGRQPVQVELTNKRTNEVVRPQPQQSPKAQQPSSSQKPRSRRGRLAAKFSTPLEN